jgi:hypothetical protein
MKNSLIQRTHEAVNNYYRTRMAGLSAVSSAPIEALRVQACINLGVDPYFQEVFDDLAMGVPATISGAHS